MEVPFSARIVRGNFLAEMPLAPSFLHAISSDLAAGARFSCAQSAILPDRRICQRIFGLLRIQEVCDGGTALVWGAALGGVGRPSIAKVRNGRYGV